MVTHSELRLAEMGTGFDFFGPFLTFGVVSKFQMRLAKRSTGLTLLEPVVTFWSGHALKLAIC